MSFELPRLTTASADGLAATSPALDLGKTSLTTAVPGLRPSSHSLLFVDRSIADYQQLVAGVAPGTEIHLLDSRQDAVTQITQTLLRRDGISSLLIVSHGEAGGLDFSSGVLNLTNLPTYRSQLQSWSHALTSEADILLYGCNVARGDLGMAFVHSLSEWTGADVAASDDLTGSAAKGGNWTLEVNTGRIETGLAFSSATVLSYGEVLDDAVYAFAQQFTSGYVTAQKVVTDSAGNVYTTGRFNGTVDFDPGAGTVNLVSAGIADIFISKLDSNGNYVWAKKLGGTSDDYTTGISVDSSGNVYITGFFTGTADFDPGAGTATLTSAGGSNIFISKLDSNGNYLWAKQLSSTSDDYARGISVDSSGNVYTTGTFTGTADFDPSMGTTTFTSAGGSDIFISKLDSNGNYLWAKQLGGSGNDFADGISVDSSGNIYTTGRFYNTVDFDPGTGTATLTSAGGSDIFISKLDSSGNYLWAKQLGGTSFDEVYGISVDSSGNIYTTGTFQSTADFDPGTGTATLTSAGLTDVFISKLDSSGNYLWAKQLGDTSFDYVYGISVDSSGNIYTTGRFTDTVDFDPGTGTANLVSAGNFDIFISKLDNSGNYIWAKQLGGTNGDASTGISVDSSGNIYTTGYFNGTTDLDPGTGTANLAAGGAINSFISKLDSSGTYRAAVQFTSGNVTAKTVVTDSAGNVYTTGRFYGTVDFDPGTGTATFISAGGSDIFISKLDSSGNYVWAKQLGSTNDNDATGISVDSSGNVYTTGYFTGTTDFDPGAGTATLVSAGGSDIFISKLDSSGNYLWAKQLGSTSDDVAYGISVDSSGNIYTTGRFYNTVDFDPGAGTATLTSAGGAGDSDIFISKLDSSGNYLWAKQLGGTSYDQPTGISVDGSGNVYTTGTFTGTTDFDPGAGTATLVSAGGSDIFISKLDSSGNYVWAKQLGGTNYDYADGISVDKSGNVYTTGRLYGTVDFDPGAGTANLTSGGTIDTFISKLDSSGNYVWAKQLGGNSSDGAIFDYVTGISVDNSGNVYTTGYFNGTTDFDPGTGTANLTNAGSFDIFISKLNSSGNYVWAKQLGGSGNDFADGISVDNSGNVYTTGTFDGTADFDPGIGTANLATGGATNSFISKLTQTASNPSPILTVSGTPLGYTENDPATLIDPTATLADPDSTDFDTGTLTVSYSANGTVDDRLAVRNQGTGSGQISISANAVSYGGTVIGTITGGIGTTALVITWNASATPTAVTALLRNLTYANLSENPSSSPRTVQLVMTDGDGHTSNPATKTINVTAVNDVPSFTKGADQTLNEDAGAQAIANWAANLSAGAAAESGQTLTFQVSNSNPTLFSVQPTINAAGTLTYTAAANANGTATVTVILKDNGGTANGGIDTAAAQTFSLTVTPVNDAPILTGNATLPAVTQNTTNPSGSSLSSLFGSLFNDIDASASLSGLAIVSNLANSTQGQWQYSIEGATWSNVGTVAEGATALALSASTLIRFVPAVSYSGTPPGLTVRALDDTYSGGFTDSTTRVTVNTTSNGGTTAISGGTPATLTTSVTKSLPNLLWRNRGTGENAVWQLNGFTLDNGYYLPTVDSNWQIVSTADFNHDGTDDLLWRNQVTGQNAIWQLNRTGFQSGRYLTSVADLNWRIVSTADFNGDGIADILWRNQASGQNAIWQMNSTDLQTGYYLTPVADSNWKIISTADFNNDGIADILWRNQASGQNAIWEMKNNFTLQSGRYITPLADSNWQIVGTADFNHDGIADLVWRNQATGQNAIWQMNSTDVKTGYYLTPVADLNWQIAGIADFDGDGSPDLLWRNAKASKVGFWQMKGFTESQTYLLPDLSPDWVVRPLRVPQASASA